jgi:hypothetical protein
MTSNEPELDAYGPEGEGTRRTEFVLINHADIQYSSISLYHATHALPAAEKSIHILSKYPLISCCQTAIAKDGPAKWKTQWPQNMWIQNTRSPERRSLTHGFG